MWADTRLLLGLYWRMDRRADRGGGRAPRLALAAMAVVLVLVSALLGSLAADLTQQSSIVELSAELVPGLLLTVVLFGMLLLGFSQALQALYLSDDLEKLLVAPLRIQAVMTAKLLGRLPSTVTVLLVLTIPALITYGLSLRLGPLYYLLGVALLLLTPLFGISLGALAAMLLVRLLPARRVNEWVGAASILLGAVLILLIYAPRLVGGADEGLDAQTAEALSAALARFGALPLPSLWAGEALVELGRGQLQAAAAGAVGAYLLLTLGLFLATIFLGSRLYLQGWLRMQSAGGRSRGMDDRPGVFGGRSLDLALAYKDWLLRIRDPRVLATMGSSVVVALIFGFLMLRPAEDGSGLLTPVESGLEGADPLSPGIVISGLALFLGWMIFSNIALASLSIERHAFYLLKTAPVSPAQLLRAKTWGLWLPYAALSTLVLLLGLLLLRFSLLWTPYAWLALLLLGYGMLSFLVSQGMRLPNLDWEDPRRMVNRKALLPSLLGVALYLLPTGLLLLFLYLVAYANEGWALLFALLGLALASAITFFFAHWCSRRVERAWPGIGG